MTGYAKYEGRLYVAPVTTDENGDSIITGTFEEILTPQGYTWNIEDLDGEEGTGRNNTDGKMFRDRRARKRKLIFNWAPSSMAETSKLLKKLSGEFVALNYVDALEGDYRIAIFYSGPQAATMMNGGIWTNIKANLIEQ